MKYLGIDFGSKRVGIAISDDGGKLAFPHSVVPNDEKLLENIEKIIAAEKVGEVVMGESKNFQGEPNEIMKEIEEFKKVLEEKTQLKVAFEQEFLTSHQAQQFQGKNEMHDASAAAIILQSFLDRGTPVV